MTPFPIRTRTIPPRPTPEPTRSQLRGAPPGPPRTSRRGEPRRAPSGLGRFRQPRQTGGREQWNGGLQPDRTWQLRYGPGVGSRWDSARRRDRRRAHYGLGEFGRTDPPADRDPFAFVAGSEGRFSSTGEHGIRIDGLCAPGPGIGYDTCTPTPERASGRVVTRLRSGLELLTSPFKDRTVVGTWGCSLGNARTLPPEPVCHPLNRRPRFPKTPRTGISGPGP